MEIVNLKFSQVGLRVSAKYLPKRMGRRDAIYKYTEEIRPTIHMQSSAFCLVKQKNPVGNRSKAKLILYSSRVLSRPKMISQMLLMLLLFFSSPDTACEAASCRYPDQWSTEGFAFGPMRNFLNTPDCLRSTLFVHHPSKSMQVSKSAIIRLTRSCDIFTQTRNTDISKTASTRCDCA